MEPSDSAVVCVFGQYGEAADPINLPHFKDRLLAAHVNAILVQHYDSKIAYNYLSRPWKFKALVGSSLGAMSAVVFAGYLAPRPIDFVGGFQPSDWDPSGHTVCIEDGEDTITRAIEVPSNVLQALCFRNPIFAATGGLGHATYVLGVHDIKTQLEVIKRNDPHPGDFGEAQDIMFQRIMDSIAHANT